MARQLLCLTALSPQQPFEASDLLLGLNFTKVLSSLVALNKVTAGESRRKGLCVCVLLSADTDPSPPLSSHSLRVYTLLPLPRHRRGQRLGVRPPLFGPSHQVLRVPVLPGLARPVLQAAAEPVSQSGNVNNNNNSLGLKITGDCSCAHTR